jgi:hypothetical protein
MNRRQFIHRFALAAGVYSLPRFVPEAFAQTSFSGKLLITFQVTGGWDVTSFCDPKKNVAGEKVITNWSNTADIGTAGNLRYAPFGNNKTFFEKHYAKTLVINGVDTQTNAHDTGVVTSWSGRTALGYPSLTALYAASVAPNLALSYLNFGGYGTTAGVINRTRISNPAEIKNIIFPNVNEANNGNFIDDADYQRIRALQASNLQTLAADPAALPLDRRNRAYLFNAMQNTEALKAFGNLIPATSAIQAVRKVNDRNQNSSIHQQIQMTLLAFKSGLTVAADIYDSGFDTHADHDSEHVLALNNVTDALDYLWTYAETLGLADRLVVVVGSDFGRTPYYNASDGKDHWAIGSYLVMEKNAGYTNRIIGETDGGHNALAINPTTMTRNDGNGTHIYSKHVHRALRKYLGISTAAVTTPFALNSTEDFAFFG